MSEWKPTPWELEKQTTDQLRGTIESLEHYFIMCENNQQGINTKESVRYNRARMLLQLKTGEEVPDHFCKCPLCGGNTYDGYCRVCDYPEHLGHI